MYYFFRFSSVILWILIFGQINHVSVKENDSENLLVPKTENGPNVEIRLSGRQPSNYGPEVIYWSDLLQGYGTETNCWLSKERGFHWSFVGPVFCVVAFNTVMLVIALSVMCRHLKSPWVRTHNFVTQGLRFYAVACSYNLSLLIYMPTGYI